jgi:hypothetical protein
VIVATAMAVLVLPAWVFGTPLQIMEMQWSIAPVYLYRSATQNLHFELAGPTYNDNITIRPGGGIKVQGESTYRYKLSGAKMKLTTSPRISDNSTTEGQAIAWFDDGATLTITGAIRDSANGNATVFSGTLLTATVMNNIRVYEDKVDSNRLLIGSINFQVTGGELQTGSNSGIKLGPTFDMGLDFANCVQMPGYAPMTNFSSDIQGNADDGGLVQCTPEPSVIALILLGTIFGFSGKRK